jgi:hypothetical protein
MGKFIAADCPDVPAVRGVPDRPLFLSRSPTGDLSQQYIGNPEIPPEAKVILIERLGLDQPLGVRYVNYMKNFFRGDFGNSLADWPRPVSSLIWERLPRTLVLFLSATLLAYYMGFMTGKVLAWRRRASHRVPPHPGRRRLIHRVLPVVRPPHDLGVRVHPDGDDRGEVLPDQQVHRRERVGGISLQHE